jgi:hypothetical protein
MKTASNRSYQGHSPPTFQWSYAVLFITNHEGVSTHGASLTGICLQMQVVWSARHHQESWMDCTCDSNITPKALFASHPESLTEGAWPKRLLIVVKNSQKHNPKNKSRVSESQLDRFQRKTFNAPQSHCLELHSFDFNVVFMWQKQSQQDTPLVSLWSRTGRLAPLFPYYLAHLESQLSLNSTAGESYPRVERAKGCANMKNHEMWVSVGWSKNRASQAAPFTHSSQGRCWSIPLSSLCVKLLCSEKDPRLGPSSLEPLRSSRSLQITEASLRHQNNAWRHPPNHYNHYNFMAKLASSPPPIALGNSRSSREQRSWPAINFAATAFRLKKSIIYIYINIYIYKYIYIYKWICLKMGWPKKGNVFIGLSSFTWYSSK